ncbi:MAG: hypothetical protein IJ447_05750 [Clostridia bacterium]|nr:hypothetical protein [Clostridia bacterium]
MNYNFDDYLNVVKLNIKNKKLHAPICAELESHLQDSADFYVEIGYDEATANEKALADMGEPAVVGESMAKLHKLSAGQILASVVFFIVAFLKLADVLLANVFITSFGTDLFYDPTGSFYFAGEYVVLLLVLSVSFLIAFWTKRIAPVIISALIAILDLYSLWSFCFVVWISVNGKLEEYIDSWREYDYIPDFNIVDYIASAILFVLLLSALLFAFVSIIRTLKNPFCNSSKIKKKISVLMLALVIVSAFAYTLINSYIDKRDAAQFEAYSKVVADLSDLLAREGKMTADDFDKVTAKFNYLEFEEFRSYYTSENEERIDVYAADIGDFALTSPRLYISKGSEGSFSVQAFSIGYHADFDLSFSFFVTFNYFFGGSNRWLASWDAIHFLNNLSDTAQPGDSLDEYFKMIKETASCIEYSYNALTGKELYSNELMESGLFSEWFYYITAEDGKFVSMEDMID